jgi:arginine transport system ATP-binding protein
LHNYAFYNNIYPIWISGLPFNAMSIILKNINCFYGTQQALFDINLTCEEGETLVLLGPSGAGKSSLLRVFNLLERPRTGELNITGMSFDFSLGYSEKSAAELRQNVGMVFQQYHLWPHLTVIQNLIEAPCRVLGLAATTANERAEKLLERLKLTAFIQRYPQQLSGGQQQRVAIARALMMEPQVLLFDEPTAALDPEITAQVVAIIKELAETKITQIIVTHEVEVARKAASQVVYMENGRILEQGSAERLIHPQSDEFTQFLSH